MSALDHFTLDKSLTEMVLENLNLQGSIFKILKQNHYKITRIVYIQLSTYTTYTIVCPFDTDNLLTTMENGYFNSFLIIIILK